ncbi:hypothetical protein MNB_SM-3-828 [hydrothermal vent metagenome]|uniref:Uncharacterized protein n=1 Tax=hydrothermal vent metagenome TaxID=652676 RepID=A0A1W1D5N2_9ZZZZ
MWLDEFKIALVTKDIQKLETLLENIPTLQSQEEIQQALFLLQQATQLIEQLKTKTKKKMDLLQKNRSFFTTSIPDQKIDLIS